MERSEQINELVAAMAKAQAKIEGASKSATNPHFKSKYADLASVWDACREPLSTCGLAIFQPVTAEGPRVTVTTMLAHTSGQFVSQSLTLTAQQDTPQAVGSAITYGRRYGLASMVGIAPEDDDGEAASRPGVSRAVSAPEVEPKGFDIFWGDLCAVAGDGEAALKAAWMSSPSVMRDWATRHKSAAWLALKAQAVKVDAQAVIA